MHRWGIAVALLLASLVQAQQLTSPPKGPYHLENGRLIDPAGRPLLIRGTQLPEFRLATAAHESRSGRDFGPYSATSLSAIRLRFNMNAVRLPLDRRDAARPEFASRLSMLVRRANALELLVIIPGEVPAFLKELPNVVSEEGLELARGWEPNFDDPAECAKLPADPAAVTRMVKARLDDFDARGVSWVVATYDAKQLVDDLYLEHASTPNYGWTCGTTEGRRAGIGRIVQAHMRGAVENGLFVVSAAGGIDVPRGGYGIAYGPVMAGRDGANGGLTLDVTDAAGVTLPARIYWASAGWGQFNFVVPAKSAVGPARITVTRRDGSRSTANIVIADTAPGFWTGVSCAGPAAGEQLLEGGAAQISECSGWRCRSLPIAPGARVKLMASGIRNAGAASKIEVTVGGVRARVVSFGAAGRPGIDQVTIEMPRAVAGRGETDVICRVNGRIANVVRVRV